MATYLGNNADIRAITSTGTPASIGEVQSWQLNTSAGAVEDSSAGDTTRTFKAGLKSWDARVTCHWDGDDAPQADLVEGASVDCAFYPEGTGTGDNRFTGSGIVTSVSIDSNFDDETVKGEFTIQGSDDLTRDTAP